jgi:hypothetical protein
MLGTLFGLTVAATALAAGINPPVGPKRLILNNDGHGGIYGGGLNSAEKLVALPQTYRDSNLWIYQWGVMLGTKVNYPSKVAELCGEGASREVLQQVRAGDRKLFEILAQLRAEGVDSLACIAKGCHAAGLLCYVTIRMNPCYHLRSSGWEGESMARFYNAKFWWEHLDWRVRLKREIEGPKNHAALSYAYPEVRARYLAIIGEVLQRDVDGVDLDFLRHPPFFGYEPPLVEAFRNRYGEDPRKLPDLDSRWLQFRADVMTGFIRQVRGLVDEGSRRKSRPLGLSARIDHRFTLEWALDVDAWFREKLLDILAVGEHSMGGYDLKLVPFVKKAAGSGCLIFASEEACVEGRDPQPSDEGTGKQAKTTPPKSRQLTIKDYCQRARKWYMQGADGIHTFNEGRLPVFRALGDARSVAEKH